MYLYETHLHTAPVSKCAVSSVRENLEFYNKLGYTGVFITNHFIDGNINIDKSLPFKDRINFYFSDYEEGVKIEKEIGIKVFSGVEMSYKGTDFLVYGLNKNWYLDHPEIEGMKKSSLLKLLRENGALVIQAHPFREASYIDHIRLFSRLVDGFETYNSSRLELENKLAEKVAEMYGLLPFAGSDNHIAEKQRYLGGMKSETPIENEADFVLKVKTGQMSPFKLENK